MDPQQTAYEPAPTLPPPGAASPPCVRTSQDRAATSWCATLQRRLADAASGGPVPTRA